MENKLQKIYLKYYMLMTNDSAKLMSSSLSNLVNNLSEGIYKIKCKFI